VGMPYGAPGASWALLDAGGVQLRRTYFDTAQAADNLAKQSAYPQIEAWSDEYLRTNYSDTEALEAFRPRSEL